ncbi:MAG: threonine/serine dehydratase [Actinomycetales bacterium]
MTRRIGRDDVERAAETLGDRVRRTPVVDIEAGVFGPEPVTLKLELLQHTGSFKARGALNALTLAGDRAAAGVIAASGGNHGLAVAWAARQVGCVATVFVPTTAPATKVAGLRSLGADVRQVGDVYADALAAAREEIERTGAFSVHAYDDEPVVAGQGTVGLELLADRPQLDTVLVAVGGGGLAGGVAAALDGGPRLVAVEPDGCPTYHAALAAGGPVDVAVGGLASDALGASRLGEHGWLGLSKAGATSVLVPPEAIAEARGLLWRTVKVAAEPGGATALAALTSGAYLPSPGERIAVVVCGGNADPADLG